MSEVEEIQARLRGLLDGPEVVSLCEVLHALGFSRMGFECSEMSGIGILAIPHVKACEVERLADALGAGE